MRSFVLVSWLSVVLTLSLVGIGCSIKKHERDADAAKRAADKAQRRLDELKQRLDEGRISMAIAQANHESTLDLLASGGQPGGVVLRGDFFTPVDVETEDGLTAPQLVLKPRITVARVPGKGWRGNTPALAQPGDFQLESLSTLSEEERKSLSELERDGRFLVLGCEVPAGLSEERWNHVTQGLEKGRSPDLSVEDSKLAQISVRAQVVVLCGEVSFPQDALLQVEADTVVMANWQGQMAGVVVGTFNLVAKKLILIGQNSWVSRVVDGAFTTRHPPIVMLSTFDLDDTFEGVLSIQSLGASYKQKEATK